MMGEGPCSHRVLDKIGFLSYRTGAFRSLMAIHNGYPQSLALCYPPICQFTCLEPAGQRAHVAVKCSTATVPCYYKPWSKALWGVYLVFMPHHSLPLREVRAELRQGQRQESWRSIASGLLSMPCSVYFLILPRTTCIGFGPAYSGLGPSTPINNQENVIVWPKASLMEACSQSRYSLLCYLRLYQNNKKLISQQSQYILWLYLSPPVDTASPCDRVSVTFSRLCLLAAGHSFFCR